MITGIDRAAGGTDMGKNRSRRRKPVPDRKQANENATKSKRLPWKLILGVAIIVCVTNAFTFFASRPSGTGRGIGGDNPRRESRRAGENAAVAPLRDFQVVNAHEHLFKRSHLDKYFGACQTTGIVRTLFVASSDFTLMGKGHDATRGNDWNSMEIIRAAKEYPGKIVPMCTIHPTDPEKLDKIKRYVAQGAKGLKLYTGHGSFWERPLDDESMFDIYAYCENTGLPICWHVNIPRYGDEFSRVMMRYPDLKVIVPHFGVAFYYPGKAPWRFLDELLETYPNLYTDTSFGTRAILVHGLEMVSANRRIFREFIDKHVDRIMFGTDMVVTGNKEKTEPWIEAVLRACRDVLEKDTYHFFMAAKGSGYAYEPANNIYGELNGLDLPDSILRKIYETNFGKLFPDAAR